MADVSSHKLASEPERKVIRLSIPLSCLDASEIFTKWSESYRGSNNRHLMTMEGNTVVLHWVLEKSPNDKAVAALQHDLLEKIKDSWPVVRFHPEPTQKDKNIWVEVRLTPKTESELRSLSKIDLKKLEQPR